MATDILTDAMASAVKAVKAAIPSQSPSVAVEGVRETATAGQTRPVRGTLSAIIASNGFADPIGDYSTASQIGQISLIVLMRGEGGWFDETPPQDGDVLIFDDGRRFTITSVTATRDVFYRIGARQC